MPITLPSPDTRCPTLRRLTLAPSSAISPEYSWPTVIGVGIVFCAHSSQLKMWMSVPQMPVLCTLTSTSSGPISGIGCSSSHRPCFVFSLTRARMGTSEEWVADAGPPQRFSRSSRIAIAGPDREALEVEIGGQHAHLSNGHAARPRQHERHDIGHFTSLEQAPGLPGLLQLLRRPVREQRSDYGAGRDRAHANAVLEHLSSHRLDKAIDRPFGGCIDRLPWRGKMGRQGTCHDNIARAPLDHVRQHVVHVLHHDIDVQIEHPVDSRSIGVDQVAADIRAGVCVQDVELTRLREDSRNQCRAILRVEQVDDQRDHGVAELVSQSLQRRFVAVDHHHLRSQRQHGLRTGQSDARPSPRHDGDLALELSRHSLPPCSAPKRDNSALGTRWLTTPGPQPCCPQTIPSALPASAKAAIAKSMSASVSAADICVRMRAWPFGTTGKKNPATNRPRSSSACASSCAFCASPSITGMIGVSPGTTVNPAFSTPSRNRRAWFLSRARRASAPMAISSAFNAPAASGGASELEKR